ncbi:MAG: GNAT family N-acetyltransferase [Myxococcota bacterium]
MLELPTERLRLFLPKPQQAELVLKYFIAQQEHLRPTDPPLPSDFYTASFWRENLKRSIEEFEADRSVRLFMATKSNPDEIIGVVNFTNFIRGPFQACYLGYSIAKQCEGKGLMFEALQAGIEYIFTQKKLHRVMANHLADNHRSAKVLQRLGFHVDGFSPDYLLIGDRWRDHVLNSLTNPNWSL